MSDVKNTTADIDNNVQKTPKSKRLTTSERDRIESELLVKALGGTLEGGRRTRSSTRGSAAPSPIIQEPVKRKASATPRRPKKVKANTVDEIDAGNAVQENHLSQNASGNNAQAVAEHTPKSIEPKLMIEKAKEATEEAVTVPIAIRKDQKTDVDPVKETKQSQESVPSTQQQPINETITIDGDSLNASPEASNDPTPPTKDEITPSIADTTTAVILEELDSDSANESQENKNSPNNDDVTIIITSPSESVSPPNEPTQSEPDNVMVVSPDIISIGIDEINDDDATDTNGNETTTETLTQIIDLSVAENEIETVAGNNNTDHSNDVEIVQDVVGSTDNETLSKVVEADKKSDATVAVNSPMEETITTTSEANVEPSAATV